MRTVESNVIKRQKCEVAGRKTHHRSISPPIVIAPVGKTAPVRFITDCSGQFGEIELSCYFPGGSVEAGLGRLLSDDHCDQGAGRHL